jgi:hypothetical protein
VYKATLPDGPVSGSISAVAATDGEGIAFTVNIDGLTVGGPWTYHLHKAPVPADGNCTATLSHLDPFGAGATVPCNPDTPELCEVGDLSGKYGKIESSPFSAEYTDPFASTKEGDVSFFGDKSFVIHYANSTRLACANFVLVDEEEDCPGSEPSHTPGGNSTTLIPSPTGGPTAGPTGGNPPVPTTTDGPPVSGASQMGALSLLVAVGALLAI